MDRSIANRPEVGISDENETDKENEPGPSIVVDSPGKENYDANNYENHEAETEDHLIEVASAAPKGVATGVAGTLDSGGGDHLSSGRSGGDVSAIPIRTRKQRGKNMRREIEDFNAPSKNNGSRTIPSDSGNGNQKDGPRRSSRIRKQNNK